MSSNRLFLALTAAVLVSACASSHEATRAESAPLPTNQFKTPVTVEAQQVLLAPHAEGLSPAQRGAVYELINTWRSRGSGPIVVETPAAGTDDVYRATAKVDAFLQTYGLGDADVRFRRYDAGPDTRAPIRVNVSVYNVEIPKCGQEWGNLAFNPKNQVAPNFGCAVTANLAAMVSNPADLSFAQPMSPADASRRQYVLEKYRSGEITSSARDDQAGGTISKAVN